MFGMRFASSTCKMLSQDWIVAKPNLVLAGEQLGDADRFSYFNSGIPPSGRISEQAEGPTDIHEIGASVASSCHPVMDQISRIRSSNESGIVLRLRHMATESRRYAKNFGLHVAIFAVLVECDGRISLAPRVRNKVLCTRVQYLE